MGNKPEIYLMTQRQPRINEEPFPCPRQWINPPNVIMIEPNIRAYVPEKALTLEENTEIQNRIIYLGI